MKAKKYLGAESVVEGEQVKTHSSRSCRTFIRFGPSFRLDKSASFKIVNMSVPNVASDLKLIKVYDPLVVRGYWELSDYFLADRNAL